VWPFPGRVLGGVVEQLQRVGCCDRAHDEFDGPGQPRRKGQPADQAGGDPHGEAERAADQLTDRVPDSVSAHGFVQLAVARRLRRLGDEQLSGHVGLEEAVEIGLGNGFQRSEVLDSGVADQQIQAAELGYHRADQLVGLRHVTDIGREGRRIGS
jgi:hypothetical protein